MRLTSNDYRNIAEQIEVGSGTIEYAKDGETIFIEYTCEEEGYVEDDFHCGYMNGTGAFVVTDTFLTVDAAESYDGDGDATANDFCESKLIDCLTL